MEAPFRVLAGGCPIESKCVCAREVRTASAKDMRTRLASLIVVKQEPLSDAGDDYYGLGASDSSGGNNILVATETARTTTTTVHGLSSAGVNGNGYHGGHSGFEHLNNNNNHQHHHHRQQQHVGFGGVFYGREPTAIYGGQGDLNNNQQNIGADFQLFDEKKCMYYFKFYIILRF